MIKAQYQSILDNHTARQIGKIGVLYGGLSDEREVSLWSGQAVYDALINVGLDAELIDVNKDFLSLMCTKPIDFAFIVLHGRGGEDGTVQAILDWLNIPYTGSGVQASAIAMDKVCSKQMWQACGLPVLPQMILTDNFDVDKVIATVGLPMAVKPALEGSSNGISKVEVREQLLPAYEKAAQRHSSVMAETWVEGDEFTAAIIGGRALPLIRIKVEDGIYDFETKYVTGADEYQCPCGLSEHQEKAIQALSLQAAEVLGVSDWCRVDVIMDKQGKVWLIELNTIPGMTKTSLVPKAARVAGLSFEETVLTILQASWENKDA
ncbi:MAG: D-alanine--D-alanine ligase [Gammaproteobacteria bacterium]|nr:MAG: D-alanine--D-alanine ligase [Gammaproteobacteria bacterium]